MRYRGSVLFASLTIGALALTGCSPIDGKMVTYDSVANHLRTAASSLESAPGVRVTGMVEDAAGRNVSIDVRLNGAGDGAGKVKRNGAAGDVLVVDSTTYVRAPAAAMHVHVRPPVPRYCSVYVRTAQSAGRSHW